MDDDFYDRLKTSLFSGGSVCDSSFISIETFIYETIGARPTDFNYDYGFVYDLPGQITMWPDNLDASVTVESKGKDNVIVQELDILKVEQSINDNFGFGMPTAFDSGFTFDTLSYRSIVKDSFRIDISSCGSSHTTSMVGKPFYNFDTIGMFDEGGTQLHV
jgi:hypothetical protein